MVQSRSASAGWGGSGLHRVLADPLGCFCFVLVLALVVGALGADWLSPWSPTALNVRQRLLSPDMNHLLGTDHLGRDILARVLHGGRIALCVSIVSVSAALTLGCVLGMSLARNGASAISVCRRCQ